MLARKWLQTINTFLAMFQSHPTNEVKNGVPGGGGGLSNY
jgi:hypothetical protein